RVHRSQSGAQWPRSPSSPLSLSLAVARSLSAKDEGRGGGEGGEGGGGGGGGENYSSQIDAVMEQLNANCELSMEDLFLENTNSASTSTLNVSSTSDGGRKGKKGRGGGGASGAAALGGADGSGLTKKSNSTSQLSVSGTKKRLGFRKKQATSFSVHRSEEVLPDEVRFFTSKQYSSVSSDGEGSLSGNSSLDGSAGGLVSGGSTGGGGGGNSSEGEFSNFVEGLGPGQIVGRQALASPSMGDIQLSLQVKPGSLEVEVVRARGLTPRSGSRMLPAPYVKVYLVKTGKWSPNVKRIPPGEPWIRSFSRSSSFRRTSRAVTVWGDKKSFMGVVQIVLDDVDLSSTVMGWYKLFNECSLINLPNAKGGGGGGGGRGGRGGGSLSGSVSGNLGGGGGSLMSASMESFN
ncbi:Rab GTPase binding, partial [Tyrophagus putrescentiae]